MAMLVTLVFPLIILMLTAISAVKGFGTSSISNAGPHGLTEILYAFTSMAGNNGSAFAGLNGNTAWYNVAGAMTMLVGRFFMIIPMLAIAGNLAKKKAVPPSAGTFPVTTPLFAGLLVAVIVVVGALTFFPALSLGPVLEHLQMMAGKTF
jgi:K+-transporting ATPase ATPase A chain